MDADRTLRAHVAVHLNGLLRVDVLRAHEPSRLVRADRNGGERQRPEVRADRREQLRRVARVAREVESPVARRVAEQTLEDPAAPQRLHAIEAAPHTPVLRGHTDRPELRQLLRGAPSRSGSQQRGGL